MKDRPETFMVDITEKPEVVRTATAEGIIKLKTETLQAIKQRRIKKGDVFTAAELAAINAVKRTADFILLAHPIPITCVKASLNIDEKQSAVKTTVEVQSIGKTGVELEALMGVMVSLLTVFDMCKYLEKDERGQYGITRISDIKVVKKSKGT